MAFGEKLFFEVDGFLSITPIFESGIGAQIVDFLLTNPDSTGLEIGDGVINPQTGRRYTNLKIRHYVGALTRLGILVKQIDTGLWYNSTYSAGPSPLLKLQFFVDGMLRKTDIKQWFNDACIRGIMTHDFAVDAVVIPSGFSKEFDVDALLQIMPSIMFGVDAIIIIITNFHDFSVDARFLQQVHEFTVDALPQGNELTEIISESSTMIDPNTASNAISETPLLVDPNQASNGISESSEMVTPNQKIITISESSAMIDPEQGSATISEDALVFVLSQSQPYQFRVGAILVP